MKTFWGDRKRQFVPRGDTPGLELFVRGSFPENRFND